MMKKIIPLFLTLFFTITALHAQQVIPATGGNASGSGGSASYTIGQIVYSTNSGANGSVAEGVQQPYEISEVTSISQSEEINLEILVYPNPATNNLTLKVYSSTALPPYTGGLPDIESFSYSLFDINGKIIETKKLCNYETLLITDHLPSGTYFLKVFQAQDLNSQTVKTFKIIKNN